MPTQNDSQKMVIDCITEAQAEEKRQEKLAAALEETSHAEKERLKRLRDSNAKTCAEVAARQSLVERVEQATASFQKTCNNAEKKSEEEVIAVDTIEQHMIQVEKRLHTHSEACDESTEHVQNRLNRMRNIRQKTNDDGKRILNLMTNLKRTDMIEAAMKKKIAEHRLASDLFQIEIADLQAEIAKEEEAEEEAKYLVTKIKPKNGVKLEHIKSQYESSECSSQDENDHAIFRQAVAGERRSLRASTPFPDRSAVFTVKKQTSNTNTKPSPLSRSKQYKSKDFRSASVSTIDKDCTRFYDEDCTFAESDHD